MTSYEKMKNIFMKHQPSQEMTKDEMELLMSLMLNKDEFLNTEINLLDKESEKYLNLKLILESFMVRIFLGRLYSLTTLKISVGALIMLSYMMRNPGDCVMIAFYMHSKLKQNTFINLTTFGMEIFPLGFFSEKQLIDIWDAQKVSKDEMKEMSCHGAPDNLLDYSETWQK